MTKEKENALDIEAIDYLMDLIVRHANENEYDTSTILAFLSTGIVDMCFASGMDKADFKMLCDALNLAYRAKKIMKEAKERAERAERAEDD